MIAAIHQPNFLPWIGYFYKMYKSDIFILLDDVQYNRRSITSRVKIKSQHGPTWLTVPVKKKGRYFQQISDVELEAGNHWKNKVLGTLQTCYGKAPHFKLYFSQLTDIIQRDYLMLADLNMALIKWLAGIFGIDTPMKKSSDLPEIAGQSSERLISICQSVMAESYLSGFGGQKYQEQELFQAAGIDLLVYDFHHPEYEQMWGEFTDGLSALDPVFNIGGKSADIIKEIEKTRNQVRAIIK